MPYLVFFRERGEGEDAWKGPFEFENAVDAERCYYAWAGDGIHEAKKVIIR